MQKKVDVARAWKDEEYRASLTPEQRASLPANPAGPTTLSDEDLGAALGGEVAATLDGGTCELWTLGCCGTCDCTCPIAA